MAQGSWIRTSVDLDGSTIRCVVLEHGEGRRPEVREALEDTCVGVTGSGVVKPEEVAKVIASIIKQASHTSVYNINKVYASIPGKDISIRYAYGIIRLKKPQVTPSDVKEVIEVAVEGSELGHRTTLHRIPIEFTLDGLGGLSNPVGLSGTTLEVRLVLVMVEQEQLARVYDVFERAGVKVAGLMHGPLAAANAVLSQEERRLGVGVLDIGEHSTSLVHYWAGSLLNIATVPYGTLYVTTKLSEFLGIRVDIAAELQKRLAFRAHGQDTIQILNTSLSVAEDIQVARAQEALHQALMDLLDFIFAQYARFEESEVGAGFTSDATKFGAGVVLTGDVLVNALDLEVVRGWFGGLPVRLGVSDVSNGGHEVATGFTFATAVGLAMGTEVNGMDVSPPPPKRRGLKALVESMGETMGDWL